MFFSSIMVSHPFFSFPVEHQNLFIISPWILQFAFVMSWRHLYLITFISLILSDINLSVSGSLVSCSGVGFFFFSAFFLLLFLVFFIDDFFLHRLTFFLFLFIFFVSD